MRLSKGISRLDLRPPGGLPFRLRFPEQMWAIRVGGSRREGLIRKEPAGRRVYWLEAGSGIEPLCEVLQTSA